MIYDAKLFAEIRRVQLEQAEWYVRETELPLKHIATECGFRSVQHMTTRFRRHFGHTPAHWGSFHRLPNETSPCKTP